MNKTISSQSNGLPDESNELLITPHLKDGQLPTFLEQAISIAPPGEMRDMLLLSALTNCAFALPAMRCNHGNPRHTYGPELMTVVLAPAASGKGIMNYGRALMRDIENVYGEQVYLSANTSSSALICNLEMFRGHAVIMATEIDTFSKAMRSGYGNFSDIVRCAFEHENIDQMRRQNEGEFLVIENPHLSILLSGTFNQLRPLISNRENGLMSRFACYVVKSIQDFDDSVWDEESTEAPQESLLYKRLGRELYERYKWMKTAKHECYFYLSDAHKKIIKRMFRSEYDAYIRELGADFASVLKRMPVIMKRIGMVLTALRLDMSKPLPERIVCTEEDFQTMLLFGHKLLIHAAMMYQMLPVKKEVELGEIGGNMLQRQFFQMLPTDFSRQEAAEQARVLGIPERTMDRWISNYTQSAEIEKIKHGMFHKKNA